MITLIEAVKLCRIPEDEPVYLRNRGSDYFDYTLLTPCEMRNRLDMRKIKVHAISTRFERFGPDFMGMEFEVSGWR